MERCCCRPCFFLSCLEIGMASGSCRLCPYAPSPFFMVALTCSPWVNAWRVVSSSVACSRLGSCPAATAPPSVSRAEGAHGDQRPGQQEPVDVGDPQQLCAGRPQLRGEGRQGKVEH